MNVKLTAKQQAAYDAATEKCGFLYFGRGHSRATAESLVKKGLANWVKSDPRGWYIRLVGATTPMTADERYIYDYLADFGGEGGAAQGLPKHNILALVAKGFAAWTRGGTDWSARLVAAPATPDEDPNALIIDGANWGAIRRAEERMMRLVRAAGHNPTEIGHFSHNGLRSGDAVGFVFKIADGSYGWILLDGTMSTTPSGPRRVDAIIDGGRAYKRTQNTAA